MTKKFTESILIILIMNLLVKPFWVFGIDRTIQNVVGADQYGMYFSLFSFSLLFNIVADFGITNYNNRNIAQNHQLINQQIGRIVPIKFMLALLYILITLFAAMVVNYSSKQIFLLSLLCFNQVLISITQYLRSNISGLQQFKTDSFLSVIDKLLLIILCSYLLWWRSNHKFQIEWLVYSQTFAYGCTLLISLLIVLYHSKKIKFSFNLIKVLLILKQSLPYATLIFLMVIYTRVDAVMLERILPNGKVQAGIYAQGFRILDALSMIAFLFASILLPLFAKMLKEKKSVKEVLSHSFALLIIPSLGLFTAFIIHSHDFMQLLYIEHTKESSTILVLLMAGFIGIAATYIFGTLLTSAGMLKILNRVAYFAVIINILLNVILIPEYQARGAAFSSMITQIAMGVIQGLIVFKYFKIKIRINTIINYFILMVILSLLLIVEMYISFDWYYSFIIIILLTFFAGFVLKILKFRHFNTLFKKE